MGTRERINKVIRKGGDNAKSLKNLMSQADLAAFARSVIGRFSSTGKAKEEAETEKELSYLYRITRDITDGLMVINKDGTVVYVNPSAQNILRNPSLKQGTKYAEFMSFDDTGENDTFHQYILDSVYDKRREHEGVLSYTCPDNNKRILRMISSYAYDESMSETIGVILQFTDVTELETARQKYYDTARLLVLLLGMLSLWNFAVGLYEHFGRPFPGYIMTMLIEIMGVIGAVYMIRYTSITTEELGLKFKGVRKCIALDGLFTAVVLAAMIIAKIIIRRTMPQLISPDSPMFYFNAWGAAETLYPLTVIVQEFLTRGAVQGSIQRIMPGKNGVRVSIILSSMFFSALHIYLGLAFMIGSFLLLSVFGVVYEKQKTIWGLCIPHYFLGLSLKIIFGVGV